MSNSARALLLYGLQLREDFNFDTYQRTENADDPYKAVTRYGYDGAIKISFTRNWEGPIYMVHRGEPVIAEWHEPQLLGPLAFFRDPDADELIAAYVAKYNLPTVGQIGWHLCAFYG